MKVQRTIRYADGLDPSSVCYFAVVTEDKKLAVSIQFYYNVDTKTLTPSALCFHQTFPIQTGVPESPCELLVNGQCYSDGGFRMGQAVLEMGAWRNLGELLRDRQDVFAILTNNLAERYQLEIDTVDAVVKAP
jgi:hypothetical protein